MRSNEERGEHAQEPSVLSQHTSTAFGQHQHRAEPNSFHESDAQLLLDAHGSLGHACVSPHHCALNSDGQFREGAETDREGADKSAEAQNKGTR